MLLSQQWRFDAISDKNIKKTVRVYRVLTEPGATAPRVSREKEAGLRHWRWAALAVVALVGAVAVAIPSRSISATV